MVNKGKRKTDKPAKNIKPSYELFHDPNHTHQFDENVQQFDILTGVEKEKKLNPKKIFENYPKEAKKKKGKKKEDTKDPNRNIPQNPLTQRGKYKKKKKGEI
jgi:hypothetical protein